MAPEQMLNILNTHGEDAASDYNDADSVHGRFGWTVGNTASNGRALLTVTYEDENDGAGPPVIRQWALVPVPATQSHSVTTP